jgi:uncharacterized protein with ATP-grasp and redox domains
MFMANIKTTALRFNLDKPLHKNAWAYLQNMDKAQFKSYNFAIATAVTDYFERYYKNRDDPYFENREREEEFVQRIVNEVEKSLSNSVPNFLTACLAGVARPYQHSPQHEPIPSPKEVSVNDIDFDFAGG